MSVSLLSICVTCALMLIFVTAQVDANNLVIQLKFYSTISTEPPFVVNENCGKQYGQTLLQKLYNKIGNLTDLCGRDSRLSKPVFVTLVPTSSFITGQVQTCCKNVRSNSFFCYNDHPPAAHDMPFLAFAYCCCRIVNYSLWLNISAPVSSSPATVPNLQICEDILKSNLNSTTYVGGWNIRIQVNNCAEASLTPPRFYYVKSDIFCPVGYSLNNEITCRSNSAPGTTRPTTTPTTATTSTTSTTVATTSTIAITTSAFNCEQKARECLQKYYNMTREEFCSLNITFIINTIMEHQPIFSCLRDCSPADKNNTKDMVRAVRRYHRCDKLTTQPVTTTSSTAEITSSLLTSTLSTSTSMTTVSTTKILTSSDPPETTVQPVEYLEILNGTDGFTLVEGEESKSIYYRINRSPEELCDGLSDCSVQISFDIISEDVSAWPRCRSTKKVMQQVMFAEDSPCSHIMNSSATWQKPQPISMIATIDGKYEDTLKAMLTVTLSKEVNSVQSKLYSTQIKVTVKDMDVQKMMCASINDPHISTFDGREYNNYFHGEFIMYRHKTLPFEVHTLYQACSSDVQASCNCAVAVKSGDDVIVIDRCVRKPIKVNPLVGGGQKFSPLSLKMYLNSELTPGTKIHEKDQGKKYFIYLPHGGYVKVLVNGDLINVWVVASAADHGHTEGLCGQFDGDKSNDIEKDSQAADGEEAGVRPQPEQFTLTWRVPVGGVGSIIQGVKADNVPYRPHKYCECLVDRQGGPRYNFASDVQTCDIYQGEDITDMLIKEAFKPILSSSRRKRDLQGDKTNTYSDNPAQTILVNPSFKPPKYTWGRSSWNEVSAKSFCDNYLKKKFPLSAICEKIPGVDIDKEIQTCIEDIQITSNTSWASSALDGLKEQCLEQLQKNGSIPDSMVNQIEGAMCINQCSGHGRCSRGTCICDDGFSGTDCTVLKYLPPKIAQLPDYGLCNVRQRNCSIATVYGQNYVNSSDLTCHIQEYQTPQGRAPLIKGKEIKVPGIYINFNQVNCVLPPLPRNTTYTVSVSNDGVKESDRLLFLPYDSICQRCDLNSTLCKTLPNSCIENGYCYEVNQTNPSGCLICRVRDGIKQWVTKDDTRCVSVPTIPNNVNLLPDLLVAIISAVIGSMCGVLIGVLLYICLCKRRKSKPTESGGIEERHEPQNTNYECMAIHRDRGMPNVTMNFPQQQQQQVEPIPHEYYRTDGPGVENGVNYDTYF